MITPSAWMFEQFCITCPEYQYENEWAVQYADTHPSHFFIYDEKQFRNIKPLYSVGNVLDLLTDDKAREEFLAEFLNK